MDPSPDDVRLNWDLLVAGVSYFIFQNTPQISKGIFLKGACGIPSYLVHIPDCERFVAAWQKTGGLRGARFDVNLFHPDVRAAGWFQHVSAPPSCCEFKRKNDDDPFSMDTHYIYICTLYIYIYRHQKSPSPFDLCLFGLRLTFTLANIFASCVLELWVRARVVATLQTADAESLVSSFRRMLRGAAWQP